MTKERKMGIGLLLIFGMIFSSLHQNTISSAAKTKIVLNKTEVTLAVKKSTALKLKKASKKKLKKKATWKSSDKSVATVTKQGKITGRKPGTAKITVKGVLKNGKKVSTVCRVTVKQQKKAVTKKPTATSEPKETEPSAGSTPTASVMPTVTQKPTVLSSKAVSGTWKASIEDIEEKVVQWYEVPRGDGSNRQIISTYDELQRVIAEAKPTIWHNDGSAESEFAQILQSYSEEFFDDKALCIGDFLLTAGYNVSLGGMTREELSDRTSRINMNIAKEWVVSENSAVICEMVPYLVIVEANKEDVAGCSSIVCNINE